MDTIFDSATFNGGNGNDEVDHNEDSATFNGGNGNDSVGNNRDSATFNGGNGDDSVVNNRFSSPTFNGGNGNDNVGTNGESATFNGGNGVDTVTTFLGGTCIDVEVPCVQTTREEVRQSSPSLSSSHRIEGAAVSAQIAAYEAAKKMLSS